jgi:hypothetical protein
MSFALIDVENNAQSTANLLYLPGIVSNRSKPLGFMSLLHKTNKNCARQGKARPEVTFQILVKYKTELK